MDVAKLMTETFALSNLDLILIATDPYSAGPADNAEWKLVSLDVIGLCTGTYDMTNYEAKEFV